MQIALDISQAAYQGTGVGRYTIGLSRALLDLNSPHTIKLCAGTLRRRSVFLALEKEFGVKINLFPLPPQIFTHITKLPLPLDFLYDNPDLLHTSDWTEPTTTCPRITTVHDLVFKIYPNTVEEGIRLAQERRLDKIVKDGTYIIADSASTKQDLMKYYNLTEDKISIVYPGISSFYKPAEKKEIDRVKTKYHLHSPFLLFVGTQEPRKNLSRATAAYKKISHKPGWEDLKLVLVGNVGWGKSFSPTSGVISLGYVPDSDLPALYSACSIFLYPSLYEGFGYPVLEAMACGAAVVTSNISSLPEISGQAAVLVDPKDELDIMSGIIKAFQIKSSLTKLAITHSSQFSWQNTAKNLIQIYERISDAHRA